MERIYLTQEDVDLLITQRRYTDHLERYLMARRFVHGTVVDLGCGIGYGSKLLSENPEVKKVVGFDICKDTIQFAKSNFSDERKIEFTDSFNELKSRTNFKEIDVLIAFELIEHIEDSKKFYQYVQELKPKVAIISFPNKPSVAYNKFHFHDYVLQDVVNIMEGYIAIKKTDIKDVTIVVFISAPEKMPRNIYKNFLEIWE